MQLLQWLSEYIKKGNTFEGCTGAVIVKSDSELYTKSFAQDVILHCNANGMAFIGHSVVEIVSDYQNFITWKKIESLELEDICNKQCRHLIERLRDEIHLSCEHMLALHASSYKTSNTLGLWHLVKERLIESGLNPEEIHIENGTVVDCKGCKFQTCMYFGEHHSCFYGGVMVEEVLPAIEKSDVIFWVCPNYNDTVSANLLAVINRLTVLYRQMSFHNKHFYAVIVSGNSGSDSVAKQLIGALNINKGFFLPPQFTIMAIANEPLKVLELKDIRKRAEDMAKKISSFCHNN
ncbi:MAG: NAD(P)H-dependent oxidoreductase [Clostridia bacterium]|nr:NAD(P)H-dependent oxidoreductase [Clostridia bacterium]